jgi:Flp pilus assembly protein TadG
MAQGRRFARDERGVTAVEFGILAIPFFTIILATMQTALVYFAAQVLDSALEDATRLVRTGQAQNGTTYGSTTALRDYMCGYTFNLFGDCSQIKLDVTVISNFDSITSDPIETCNTDPLAGPLTCTLATPPAYNGGAKQQIVQVRAYYRYPLVIVLPYFNLKNQPDNYRLIGALRVFKNEPF